MMSRLLMGERQRSSSPSDRRAGSRLRHAHWWVRCRRATGAVLLALLIGLAASGCSGLPLASAPTPTPASPQARLSARVNQALQGTGTSIAVGYDPSSRAAEVVITQTNVAVPRSPADIASAQERVKALCFAGQRTTWTSGESLAKVSVSVKGPQFDDYADVIVQGYGGAILSAAVAQQLDWGRLSADAAWSRYDQTWLSSEFSPYQQWWETPTTTANP